MRISRASLLALLTLAACNSPPPIPPLPDSGPIDAGVDADVPVLSCDNSTRDGDETGVDCGGSCTGCPDGDGCVVSADCASLVCDRGRCLVPTCSDGVRNADETGRDCGGDCDLCPGGEPCTTNDECLSGRCSSATCTMSGCEDSLHNGDETDVDCGGPTCSSCAGGAMCDASEDCESFICETSICSTAACDDSIQNGVETSIDCGGGTCPGCRDGLACVIDSDCEGMRCLDGGCVSCTDLTRNAEETDVDCGGSLCPACADLLMCIGDSDCESSTCIGSLCVSCSDMAMNQDETDVDCGGAVCPGCAAGGMCVSDADCDMGTCVGGSCISCADGIRNQDETDIDCGGTLCLACAPGFLCSLPRDCGSAICDSRAMRCNAPGCGDGMLNGAETDLDCGGGSCLGCADGLTCVIGRDCRNGVCAGALCQSPTCMDGVANGLETDVDCGGPTPGCARCAEGRRCTASTDCMGTTMCSMGFCGMGLPFRGFASFVSVAIIESDAVQDMAADAACTAMFPGSRPATANEVALGLVFGLPPTNTSGFTVVPNCPGCAGDPCPMCPSGHARNCVDPGMPYPTSLPWSASGACIIASANAICVR